MSKKQRAENLASFIGLQAAHLILIRITNKPESTHHLNIEARNYANLSNKYDKYAEGNWNSEDLEMIRELAIKRCKIKLGKYPDIEYEDVDVEVDHVMRKLGLYANV